MFELQAVTSDGTKETRQIDFNEMVKEILDANNRLNEYSYYRVLDINTKQSVIEWSH